MNWAVWVVLAIVALVLAAAGAIASNPAAFVYGLAKMALADLWPVLRPLLLDLFKRMPGEEEAAWRKRYLDGSKDDRR